MRELLIFALATIGLTNIIVHGKILDVLGIRPWIYKRVSSGVREGMECYECAGFWSGLLVALAVVSWNPLLFVPLAFAGSVLSQFHSELLYLMRGLTTFEVNDEPKP